jgi:hypothetical protein
MPRRVGKDQVLRASQLCLCIAYVVGRVPVTRLRDGRGTARDGKGLECNSVVVSLVSVSRSLGRVRKHIYARWLAHSSGTM